MESESESTPLIRKSNPRRDQDNKFTRIVKPCAAEFLTTAIFVFIGTTSVQTGNGLLEALAHGMTIALLVHCFGDISGAHINPAVTLTVFLGSAPFTAAKLATSILFIISQLVGSIAGAGLNRAVLWFPLHPAKSNETVYEFIGGGTHHLAPGLPDGQAILLEAVMTFLLCQTVLHVAVERSSPHAPMAIGLSVFVDIAVGGNLTGASMNPARSFGPAVVISDLSLSAWNNHYVYWAGPFAGATLAALVFRFFFATGSDRLFRSLGNPENSTLNVED